MAKTSFAEMENKGKKRPTKKVASKKTVSKKKDLGC